MGTNESGLSHHPEDIKSALARESIILGPESVGIHFRNSGEIADVLEVVMDQKGAISVGLVGSRIHGRFSYTGTDTNLFTKLCFFFQRNLELSREEEALSWKSNFEIIPERFQQPFNDIAVLLNSAQKSHDNLDDIDLSQFPLDLQQFLTFEPWAMTPESLSPIPYIFLPIGFDQTDRYMPTLLRPAAYFPDIDVAVISEEPLIIFRKTIGTHSGVGIDIPIIHPFENESPWPGSQEAIESMVKNFRPFSKPALAE